MHELSEINPEGFGEGWFDPDPTRPLELITVVLRAAIFGYVKSCDLTWRELSRKRVFEVRVTCTQLFAVFLLTFETD